MRKDNVKEIEELFIKDGIGKEYIKALSLYFDSLPNNLKYSGHEF